MSDDTPTQRLDAAEVQEDLHEEQQKSKGLLIGLIAAGALLLVAIIVLVVFLVNGQGDPDANGSPTPDPTSASATPEPTDSETPSPSSTPSETSAPPPPTGPTIASFTTGTTGVYCEQVDNNPVSVDLAISWSTSNANRVYFGVDTNDASVAPFFSDSLPASGSSANDFPSGYSPFQFSCGSAQHTYTLTIVDGSGNKVSKSITVKDLSA